MNVVTLTAMDDEILFRVATALGEIAADLREGREVEDLAAVLNGAGMAIAAVMAGAYEREADAQGLTLN